MVRAGGNAKRGHLVSTDWRRKALGFRPRGDMHTPDALHFALQRPETFCRMQDSPEVHAGAEKLFDCARVVCTSMVIIGTASASLRVAAPMLNPKYPLLLFIVIAAAPLALFAQVRTDQQIEEAAKSSYTLRRLLDGQIDVKVRDGVATLSGRVRDADQSRLAEDTVANLDGVKRVENQVKLDPMAKAASDEWLAVKIRSKLLLARDLSLAHAKVDVRDGIVTLSGTTDSNDHKARAEQAIREIVGVRQVRNLLHVGERTASAAQKDSKPDPSMSLPAGAGLPTGRNAGPQSESGKASLRADVEDAAISTQIKFQLLTHDDTSALKTKIETENGRVVITGEAESELQRQRVTDLARSVRGVSHVENKMVVRKQ